MSPTRAAVNAFSWLDLKIPLWGILSLGGGLIAQSAALLIWATNLNGQTQQNTAAIVDLQLKAANVASLRETVARIDERTQAMVVTVNRMDEQRGAQK
jgi:hypothetical protein